MDKPNFAAMTPEQRRDWLAEQEGWKRRGDRWRHPVYHKLGSGQKRHPMPNTLDAAAEAMPEGIRVQRHLCDTMHRWEYCLWKLRDGKYDEWYQPMEAPVWPLPDTGNEINDRFHLACECVWAERERS